MEKKMLSSIILKEIRDFMKILKKDFNPGAFEEEVPNFKFALREDLKDNKEFLPVRATSKSAGWDVACAFENHKSYTVYPGEYLKIPLGLRCIPPEGYWLECRPRSSSFAKKKLHALYGVCDEDYRGALYFCSKYDGNEPLILEFGEKIGQIIPYKMQDMSVSEITNVCFDDFCAKETNDRKDGGFGSSDKK